MVRVFSPHCPNCAAALRFDTQAKGLDCEYCGATLILDLGSITHRRSSRAPAEESAQESTPRSASQRPRAPIAQPDPTLSSRDAARFTMRIVEQKPAGPAPGIFRSVELGGDRFAVAALRCTDDDGAPVALGLSSAFDVLVESLEDDGDPGLAVNLALEEIARDARFQKLEACVCVFDPARTTATVYSAGPRDTAMWVSTEEARAILAGPSHQALVKSDLARRGQQFDNGRTIQLAALDLIVITSFAFLSDPVIGQGGAHVLGQTLREHLAEDPERVVTLVKNGFWDARATRGGEPKDLAGDLIVAAIGARLAAPENGVAEHASIDTFETPRFDVALQRSPGDRAEVWRLDPHRHALLWVQGLDEGSSTETFKAMKGAVTEVLGNSGHGDFDNPRAAGRHALQSVASDDLCCLVAHLSDEHRRVKYFTQRWKAGAMLGARGLRPDHEQQQFDEGGELTLHDHERVFFPGALDYEGEISKAEDLAACWFGGKSSHLYEALRLHWRTRRCERMLQTLYAAVRADVPSESTVAGLGLMTGKRV